MNHFEGIVEIDEAHGGIVNRWLEAGYRLLAIESESRSAKHPGPAGQFYVRRQTKYIVGRSADVAHFDLAPRESQPEAAEGVPA